jgi:hypothetical protein
MPLTFKICAGHGFGNEIAAGWIRCSNAFASLWWQLVSLRTCWLHNAATQIFKVFKKVACNSKSEELFDLS